MSPDERIKPHAIEEQMQESYIDYAMSVIVARALPDVRDGFKPVHRRIIYAMHESGLRPSRPYSKCAKVVGEVLGKYHPHGDRAVYDSLVRMAQSWNLRYPLIDGQGNFGSIDGDSAAAYRYTECRLAHISEEFTADLDKDTVDFVPSFDEKEMEPTVLPAQLPNLLINGSSGIAVGMATNIPPHNLGETVGACIAMLDNPQATVGDIMKHIPGPDFPTGGIILGRNGIYDAYTTGRGKVTVRAVAHTETAKNGRESIIITEIPYQTNKARILEEIADLVREKRIEGISDIRDESDRKGMRVVIELKRDGNSDVILNNLYKHSRLQTTYSMILLALVENRPVFLSIAQMIRHFLEHRKEVIIRRTRYLLDKALKRAHILEGLLKALDIIDQIIQTIRASADGEEASGRLVSEYGFTEIQAKAILDMRLQRLTGLERDQLVKELNELNINIADYRDILGSPARVDGIIKAELTAIRDKYGDIRRTQIMESAKDIVIEDTIADEDRVITITHAGYIKSQSPESYRAQSRGGKGRRATANREDDYVQDLFIASMHSYLLLFSDKGKAYWLKVYYIPQGSPSAKGKPVINCINIEKGEKITAIVPVKEFVESQFLVMVTAQGVIKKVDLTAFANPRKVGIIAIDLDENDYLVNVFKTNGENHIIVATSDGKACHFHESEVRPMGRTARGVKAIKLRPEDVVVNAETAALDGFLLTVTANGYGKRTALKEYRMIHRGGQGVINIDTSERNGVVAGTVVVRDENEEVMIITRNGTMIRQKVKKIRPIGRATQGYRLIRLEEDDQVAAITLIRETSQDTDDDDESLADATEIEAQEEGASNEPESDEGEATQE